MAFSVAAGDGRVRAAAGLISTAIMATAAIAPETAPIFWVIMIFLLGRMMIAVEGER
jgi:hypothetical protein